MPITDHIERCYRSEEYFLKGFRLLCITIRAVIGGLCKFIYTTSLLARSVQRTKVT